MSADRPEEAKPPGEKDRRSPVKTNPLTLKEIASRFNMPVSEGTTKESTSARMYHSNLTMKAQSLKRLGLAGRLESAAESASKSGSLPWSKAGSMPSLSDIRARLNQRGVDVTSSKWSKRNSGSPENQSPEASPIDPEPVNLSKPLSDEALKDTNIAPSSSDEPADNVLVEQDASEELNEISKSSQVASELTRKTESETNKLAEETPVSYDGPLLSGREEGLAAKNGKKHPLEHAWTLYYDLQRHHGQSSSDQYEATLKCVGEFTTLESFFDTFATLHRPSRLEKNANYHLFKSGVKPMWEDPANAKGGRWVITLRDRAQTAGSRAAHEALVDRSWMWLVLALIGETLDDDGLVTGAVCSLRGKGDRIALWTRAKEPVDELNKLGKKLLQLLELENEPSAQLEFGVNFGSKDPGYIKQHLGGKSQSTEIDVHTSEPALESWLESDATLHPTDHMRYFGSKTAKPATA